MTYESEFIIPISQSEDCFLCRVSDGKLNASSNDHFDSSHN